MKTILIITPNFLEPTAWMISAYKTAVNLAKHAKVVVITSQTKGSKKYEIIKNVEVYRSKSFYLTDPFNSSITPFIFSDVNKLICKYDPDIFFISKYMFVTSLVGIQLRLKGKQYFLQTDTFPGIDWFAPSKILNVLMYIYAGTIGRIVLKLSKKVILLHEGLISTAKKLNLKYSVVHNGVDIDNFTKVEPAEDIKLKNKFIVTYVGRLDDVKGYNYILEAAKVCYKKYGKEIKFVFVCGDKYKDKRKNLEKLYPYITFFGFRKDIPRVFKASNIHVLASYSEGLPNSILEAMAARCSIVTTSVGAIPYFIKNNYNGLIVRRNNSKDIVKAIEHLKNNPVKKLKMVQNAYNTIFKEFNWKILSKKLLDELQ